MNCRSARTRARFAGYTLLAAPFTLLLFLALISPAQAVPSFARQTGQECVACHVSFPELTPYGRFFKLTGYTIGKPFVSSEGFNYMPMAVMAQTSVTNIQNNYETDPTTGQSSPVIQRNNGLVFCCTSVFFATKFTDWGGVMVQWTYNNLATSADGTLGGHSSMDNTDLRAAYKYSSVGAVEPDWIFGATINNNPTMQDVWNSTPAWGFPYTVSPLAPVPSTKAQIYNTLAQQVAGLGAYAFWQKTLYGEVSFYRTANGAFSVLSEGLPVGIDGGVAALKGYNPYWRLAYNKEWGPNSLMVGTYGMFLDRYPSNLMQSTPTDRYKDAAVDAQYQYITDPHTFTAQLNYVWERQNYNASYPVTLATGAGIGAGPTPANPSDTLHQFLGKATYYYNRQYGGTIAYFSTTGSSDSGLYGTDANGNPNTPNSNGWIFELDYLPIQNIRIMFQYTGYNKFNGASTNYDGNGRNAHDNNTAFFNVWVAF
jgi:hypothetical protein